MKTKIVTVLLTLMFFAGTTYSQEHGKSMQKTPSKVEKSSEMSKPSSEPCCPEMKSGAGCEQMDKKSTKMDHSKMDHSKMNTPETKDIAVAYTCPMHAEVKSDKPGKCPTCSMDLVKKN